MDVFEKSNKAQFFEFMKYINSGWNNNNFGVSYLILIPNKKLILFFYEI